MAEHNAKVGDNRVSKELLQAIKVAVDQTMAKWTEQLKEIEERLSAMSDLESKVEVLEKENSDLRNSLNRISKAAALKSLDTEVYSRKWNLIVYGIPGPSGESERDSEAKVRQMAKDDLLIPNPSAQFSACHRLSQKDNAGIIVKFTNLNDKNEWLAKTKNLKNSSNSISISPDIPQVLNPLKKELLIRRKSLKEQKSQAKIKYHKSWPYISLKLPDGSHHRPNFSVDSIVQDFLTLN
jgi:hypothetical protein